MNSKHFHRGWPRNPHEHKPNSDIGKVSLEQHALLLKQKSQSLLVDEQGSISLHFRLAPYSMLVIIEEDVLEKITRTLKFAGKVLEKIDPTERLSHIVITAIINGAEHYTWRTQKEHEASPNRVISTGAFGDKREAVTLLPPHRSRSALRIETAQIAEDIITLLRRSFKR